MLGHSKNLIMGRPTFTVVSCVNVEELQTISEPFSEKLSETIKLSNISEYIKKYDINKYTQGILYYSKKDGNIEGLLFYTPIRKELFRAYEDKVVINSKSVNRDMFTNDAFCPAYGLLLGPLVEDSIAGDTIGEDLICECITRNGITRRYVTLTEEKHSQIFANNQFYFLADVKNKYLMLR